MGEVKGSKGEPGMGGGCIYSCCVSFFFFLFCSFSKNVTIKIQKIKSLFWGLQFLAPQTPPPQKSPVGKGSREGLKKEKRKKPHFSVFFFLRRARSR